MKELSFDSMHSKIRKGSSTYTDDVEKSFKSSAVTEDPLEQLNLNTGYLLALIRMIDEFSLTEINKSNYSSENSYIEHLWRIVRSMLRLLACKMQPDTRKEFKKRIHESLILMNKMSVGNGDYIDTRVCFNVEAYIGEIFEDLISHMEERGMLTFKKENPMNAMGKFSD